MCRTHGGRRFPRERVPAKRVRGDERIGCARRARSVSPWPGAPFGRRPGATGVRCRYPGWGRCQLCPVTASWLGYGAGGGKVKPCDGSRSTAHLRAERSAATPAPLGRAARVNRRSTGIAIGSRLFQSSAISKRTKQACYFGRCRKTEMPSLITICR